MNHPESFVVVGAHEKPLQVAETGQFVIDFAHPLRTQALAFIYRWPFKFRPDFAAWLETNWSIWSAFEKEANRIYARGRRHYGARTIIEWLRHETALQEGPSSDFKINGNYVPDLARLWLCHYPERDGFFELRHLSDSEVRAA